MRIQSATGCGLHLPKLIYQLKLQRGTLFVGIDNVDQVLVGIAEKDRVAERSLGEVKLLRSLISSNGAVERRQPHISLQEKCAYLAAGGTRFDPAVAHIREGEVVDLLAEQGNLPAGRNGDHPRIHDGGRRGCGIAGVIESLEKHVRRRVAPVRHCETGEAPAVPPEIREVYFGGSRARCVLEIRNDPAAPAGLLVEKCNPGVTDSLHFGGLLRRGLLTLLGQQDEGLSKDFRRLKHSRLARAIRGDNIVDENVPPRSVERNSNFRIAAGRFQSAGRILDKKHVRHILFADKTYGVLIQAVVRRCGADRPERSTSPVFDVVPFHDGAVGIEKEAPVRLVPPEQFLGGCIPILK